MRDDADGPDGGYSEGEDESDHGGWGRWNEGWTAGTTRLTGKLLVALPVLADGNFRRSVVLILDHDDDGGVGVILNRPLDADADDFLPEWSPLLTEPAGLFEGGPVATDSALGLALLATDPESPPLGWRPMFGRIGLVDLDTPVDTLVGAVAGMRIFAGYAGWGEGQLEAEIEEGSWLVLEAVAGDLLKPNPQDLWRDVLRRQPDDTRLLSTYPDDPALN